MSHNIPGLNSAQMQAVNHDKGPALVVAGAGTGKTRVIVERICRLIDSGVDRRSILALTFTEKAAQEMLDRVGELLEEGYGIEVPIRTYNAFGQEMLHEFSYEIGLGNALQLVGDTGKVVLLREHLDELGLDYFAPISQPDGQLRALADYFSKLKQQLIQPQAYMDYASTLKENTDEAQLEKKRHTELSIAFDTYIRICRRRGVIDYDDQLYLLVGLLEKRPNVLRKLQQRYQYVLVDEFQDTNPMQSRLLDLLAGEHQNLMTVGDDDQSIYGWRGATLSNILDFTKRYPEANQITLIENYRSTQAILDNAYTLIQHNNPNRLEAINGLDKRLISQKGEGVPPNLHHFSQLSAELEWVADDIKKRIKKGARPGSIAVLARRNHGAKLVHETLNSHGIENTLTGVGNDIYGHPIIATMVEALKSTVDPHDDQALYHTLGGPLFDLNPTLLGNHAARARREHTSLEATLKSAESNETHDVLNMIRSWREQAHQKTVGAMSYMILDQSGLKDTLYASAETSEEAARTVQTLGHWFESLRQFQDIASPASTVHYLANYDALRAGGETLTDDTASITDVMPTVMSVHRAKGLEWDTVYIVDCSENSFPLRNTRRSSLIVPEELSLVSDADDHIAEERRLMYVASTRAREELIVSFSDTHNGTTIRKPSRFLIEMFGEDAVTSTHTRDQEQTQMSLGLFSDPTRPSLPRRPTLPQQMVQGSQLVLSTSQMNDYLRCPRDFYYRHVLNVPPAPSPQAAVGTIFHNIIQTINEAKMRKEPAPSIDVLRAHLEGEWPLEGYHSAAQRNRARTVALSALEPLYVRLLDEPIPVAVESPFRVRIPDSQLVLKGRIDAVMPLEKGVEIRDYKTSTSANTPKKAKSQTQSSKQLEMYALAWLLQHDEMPALLSLDFVQTNLIGSVAKREKTLHTLTHKLQGAATGIADGNFPLGYSHDYCRHPAHEEAFAKTA